MCVHGGGGGGRVSGSSSKCELTINVLCICGRGDSGPKELTPSHAPEIHTVATHLICGQVYGSG